MRGQYHCLDTFNHHVHNILQCFLFAHAGTVCAASRTVHSHKHGISTRSWAELLGAVSFFFVVALYEGELCGTIIPRAQWSVIYTLVPSDQVRGPGLCNMSKFGWGRRLQEIAVASRTPAARAATATATSQIQVPPQDSTAEPCNCGDAPVDTEASEQAERSYGVWVAFLATVSVCGALLNVHVGAAVAVCTARRQRQRVDVQDLSTQVRCPNSSLIYRTGAQL